MEEDDGKGEHQHPEEASAGGISALGEAGLGSLLQLESGFNVDPLSRASRVKQKMEG